MTNHRFFYGWGLPILAAACFLCAGGVWGNPFWIEVMAQSSASSEDCCAKGPSKGDCSCSCNSCCCSDPKQRGSCPCDCEESQCHGKNKKRSVLLEESKEEFDAQLQGA